LHITVLWGILCELLSRLKNLDEKEEKMSSIVYELLKNRTLQIRLGTKFGQGKLIVKFFVPDEKSDAVLFEVELRVGSHCYSFPEGSGGIVSVPFGNSGFSQEKFNSIIQGIKNWVNKLELGINQRELDGKLRSSLYLNFRIRS